MPETTEKRPLKVFLCHASADKAAVRELYQRLTKDGVDAWLDKEKLLPGQDWKLEIEKAVRESDVVVVCLSKQFNLEGFRQKEVRWALDKAMEKPEGEIFIIPARLDECEALESLRKWHWVDLFKNDGYENLMRALRLRADRIGTTLVKKRKSRTEKEGIVLTSVKTEEAQTELSKSEVDKPKAKKRKTTRKPNATVIAAWIGSAGLVIAAFLGSPLLVNLLNGTPEPTLLPSPTHSASSVKVASLTPDFATVQVVLTLPTKSPIPTQTNTPEPGYEVVGPVEVLNIAPTLRTFGQLAVEKYSLEERNKTNGTLVFTVNSTTDVPILWRWFWCAANDRILEQNMTKIGIIFEADGHAIPQEQLATVIFENADPAYQGWKCRTYETVLRNWKPGTYQFIQTVTIASDINDGGERFEAGVKIYEYTVNISE